MLRGVLESQVPPKQTAEDTINTFSSRLSSATLLEDRRQAIVGLRSFAKQYPASVASGGLRGLIQSLTKDVDDVDTGKIVLETLLMLFNPNEDSPEASDDIALWLADEFSQRQDNITVLLNFLEKGEFYSSLYSLQLLSAICSARPERTQQCILEAPLGPGRLVAVLDDPRDAIRSAGLLLLNDATESSLELQKVVAFESAFDRVLNLIQAEGSLAYGGIVVQDCLTLLANLLHMNPSNQSLFRESGHVATLARLFNEEPPEGVDPDDGPSPPSINKDKNMWGILAVLRMFLIRGSMGTQANQNAFEKHGILQQVLNLSFSDGVSEPIRAEALRACADVIRGNAKLQERFAHNQVPVPDASPSTNGTATPNGDAKKGGEKQNGNTKKPMQTVYIIDALLDMALSNPSISMFDVRFAAAECIQAYFYDHTPIRHHFLRRAIEGHSSGEDETSNMLSILIGGPRSYQGHDPYRIWFAALMAFRLVFDDSEAKTLLMGLTEGDADQGEEVVSCIQVITGNLIAAFQEGEDERICIGYLILLCGWFFEDDAAVNDCLSESSTLESLIDVIARPDKDRALSQGLCAALLGILYEFSTKDSPVPRRKLQPRLLDPRLGREQYIQRLNKLRENPSLRDFEVLPQNLSSSPPGTLPQVFLDSLFVEFIKDHFSRITRALDKDPGLEAARPEQGVDRDLVDSLRSQLEVKNEALQKAETDLLDLDRKLNQSQGDQRRTQETLTTELTRIKNINDALQKGHEAEIGRLENTHRTDLQNMRDQHGRQTKEANEQAEKTRAEAARLAQDAETDLNTQISQHEKRAANLEKTVKQREDQIEALKQSSNAGQETTKQLETQIKSLTDSKTVLEESIELKTSNIRNLEEQIQDYEKRLKEAREKESSAQAAVKEKEEARASVQTELDDLLIVLGDLEDKRSKDKAKLKELGAETSDDDEDGDEEDEEDEGEEGETNKSDHSVD